MRYLLLLGFLVAGVADLYFISADLPYRQFSKPLIMLALIGYFLTYWNELSDSALRKTFLVGLGCAWLGDVLLLNESYFVVGLLSFFIMQRNYIICFVKDGINYRSAVITGVILIPLAIYVTLLMWPNIGTFKIPVIFYMVAILLTAISASARNSSMRGYYLVLIGALIFVVSDTVLALHKFTPDIRLGSLTVMITYISAQFLIVEGYVRGHRSN